MTFSRAFALLALATVGIAPSAEAASIRLNDFTRIIEVADNSLATINGIPSGNPLLRDSDPTDGSILFEQRVDAGNFIYNFELGITKPLLGSATSPIMFLALAVQSGTGGEVEISFSETGFGPSSLFGSYGAFFISDGRPYGMSNGITYEVLQDTANNLFAGQVIGSTTSTTDNFVFEKSLTLIDDPEYSLTQRFTMTLGPQETKIVRFGAVAAVPDGGMTLGLFGLALIGMERLRRKFKR